MTMAYSYIRFSTPEQMKGDSKNRQQKMAHQYCNANGLTLDTTLNLEDGGVSAFKGKNLEATARLGGFLQAVDKGKVPKGSYLLIENFDRLSRQGVEDAFPLFASIINKGITVVTLNNNEVYNKENFGKDLGKQMLTFLTMCLANQESVKKSDRLRAANKSKREKIDREILTSHCPAWLKPSKDKSGFIKISRNVNAVKTIFELYVSGLGVYSIIKELNNRKIKPIGKSNAWAQSYIHKILKGREVLGELVSNSADDGQQIFTNYYPQIIPDELYYKALAIRKTKEKTSGGRRGDTITNLFAKIAVCGYSVNNDCTLGKTSMVHVNKSKYCYLQCRNAKTGNCKRHTTGWRYEEFEKALLLHLKEIDSSVLFENGNENKVSKLSDEVNTIRGQLSTVRKHLEVIENTMLEKGDTIPKTVLNKLTKLEKEEEDLSERLKKSDAELAIAQTETNTPAHHTKQLNQMLDILPTLKGDELHAIRVKLSSLLREFITSIEVFTEGTKTRKKIAKINYKSGAVRYVRQVMGGLYDSITHDRLMQAIDAGVKAGKRKSNKKKPSRERATKKKTTK